MIAPWTPTSYAERGFQARGALKEGQKRMPTYSLWLEPKGHLNTRLQEEIELLSQSFDGPIFEPHVTLVPGFEASGHAEAIALAEKVAMELKAFEIEFDKVHFGGIFFQCVFILCKKNAATMEANTLAVNALGLQQWEYMPHLSLLYSDMLFTERNQIADLEHSRLFEDDNDPIANRFLVDRIHLWATQPDDKSCESWEQIKELPLRGQ